MNPLTIGAAAAGAAGMYFLDPDRGRRRRAFARDKAVRLGHEARENISVVARDFGHRAIGAAAEARRWVAREEAVDDDILVERVRAALGHLIRHPHAIEVLASAGQIVLRGTLGAAGAGGPELRKILFGIGRVRGVRGVRTELRAPASEPGEKAPLATTARLIIGAVALVLLRRAATGREA